MLSELLMTEMLRLDRKDKQPLHRQLYSAIRRAILDGKLGAGDRLPSSRELTLDLKLSRNTVIAAINQLIVEGYLVSHVDVTDRPRYTGVSNYGFFDRLWVGIKDLIGVAWLISRRKKIPVVTEIV